MAVSGTFSGNGDSAVLVTKGNDVMISSDLPDGGIDLKCSHDGGSNFYITKSFDSTTEFPQILEVKGNMELHFKLTRTDHSSSTTYKMDF
jgi:hypothetical protein